MTQGGKRSYSLRHLGKAFPGRKHLVWFWGIAEIILQGRGGQRVLMAWIEAWCWGSGRGWPVHYAGQGKEYAEPRDWDTVRQRPKGHSLGRGRRPAPGGNEMPLSCVKRQEENSQVISFDLNVECDFHLFRTGWGCFLKHPCFWSLDSPDIQLC